MSMAPNDPFENPNSPGASQQQPPQKKGGKGCLIGCGIAGILGVLVCCGGGVFMAQFGVGMYAEIVQDQLADDPVMVENIGEIESITHSWSGTIAAAQEAEGGDSPLSFDVQGSKGSGQLRVVQDKSGDGTGIKSAVLILEDGTRIPLELSQVGVSDLDDIDMQLNDLIDTGEATDAPAEPIQLQPAE
ncbi:MAG: cytochrome c oxidase assembly factor Coa1 family protein [Rubripirellula sp.]